MWGTVTVIIAPAHNGNYLLYFLVALTGNCLLLPVARSALSEPEDARHLLLAHSWKVVVHSDEVGGSLSEPQDAGHRGISVES